MEAYMLSPDHLVVAGVLNDIAVYSFRTMFFVSAVLLMAIVLMQEGKGGGLASALGGQGAETFGVSTGGVNKVTLFLAGIFLFSALGHALSFQQSVMAGEKGSKKASTGSNGTGGGATEEQMKKALEDAMKEAGEPAKDGTPKDPLKETPKDAPKEAPKDAPKEAPKEAPKDPPADAPKDAPVKTDPPK